MEGKINLFLLSLYITMESNYRSKYENLMKSVFGNRLFLVLQHYKCDDFIGKNIPIVELVSRNYGL